MVTTNRGAPESPRPGRLSARQLNRATLERQLLLDRRPLAVPDAVRHVVALQAQEPASPYLALWNRLAAFDPAALDRAFADRAVVKASLMRITLHAVYADDYPSFHNAVLGTLRASRLNDRRFAAAGVTIAEADELVRDLVAFASEPRTKVEIEAMLADRVGGQRAGLWWALRTLSPLHHAPIGGPWTFGSRASFVAAGTPVEREPRDASVRHLVRRYLEGFGPASVPDLAQFALIPRAAIRDAIRNMDGELVELEGPDGAGLLDLAGASIPPEDMPAPPRLMAMWDSVLLAYADRSRLIPPDYRPHVIRRNGDVLPSLLVDGFVAGVWRPVEGGVEATAFHPLPEGVWQGLAAEAAGLVAFLADRDPAVYRRYRRWWQTLPGAEVRVLPG
jgi:hypothetical protein